jgi:hypothetical protein
MARQVRYQNRSQKSKNKTIQVDYELVKVWVEKKITKLLGEEDDIVSGTIISHLD